MGKQRGADHLTPSGRFFGSGGRGSGGRGSGGERRSRGRETPRPRPDARPIRLLCPGCGATISVYEDEIGRSGKCPGCGAMIAVPADALAGAPSEARAGAPVRAALVRPAAPPRPGARQEQPRAPAQARRDEPPAAVAPLGPSEQAQDPAPMPAPRPRQPEVALQSNGRAVTASAPWQYDVWQGLAAEAGDTAMAARLEALRKAGEARCSMTFALPSGAELPVAQMVLCEAAVGASKGQSEDEWRRDWSRLLVKVAAQGQDEVTFEAVVAVLARVDSVVTRLRAAGAWPWTDGGAGVR